MPETATYSRHVLERTPAGGSGAGSRAPQALGVLALSVSVAVVVLLAWVVPHTGAQATRHGAPGVTNAHGSPATETRAPAATTGSPSSTSGPTASTAATPATTPSVGPSTLGSGGSGGMVTASGNTTTQGTLPGTATSTTAPAASTASPTYTPPHVAAETWPGNLSYPDDVSATYPLTSTGGEVSATATWSGTPTLMLDVSCSGNESSQSGGSDLYVAVDAAAGSCLITLSEPAGVQATVSYSLSVDAPSA